MGFDENEGNVAVETESTDREREKNLHRKRREFSNRKKHDANEDRFDRAKRRNVHKAKGDQFEDDEMEE